MRNTRKAPTRCRAYRGAAPRIRKMCAKSLVVFAGLLPVGLAVGAGTPSEEQSIIVVTVSMPRVETTASARSDLPDSCGDWWLTAPQVEAFFRRSGRIGFAQYIHHFDTASCSVDGTLRAAGRTWQFTINAAGKGLWREESNVRYFGCWTEERAHSLGLQGFVVPGSI